ncbi:calcium-binding protein [Streptomyces sp. NPDC003860]
MRNRLRTRTATSAVGATLALTALVVPGAQAAASPVPPPPTTVDGYASNTRFVVGTTAPKTVTVTFWATDPFLVKRLGARLFQGSSPADAQRWWHPTKTACTGSATRKHCTATFVFDPRGRLANVHAGRWGVQVWAAGTDDVQRTTGYFVLKHASRLTVNATPEPAKRGRTITVHGRLTRANWDTGTYTGYAGVPVVLSEREPDRPHYARIGTATTDRKGFLKARITAKDDRLFRYSYNSDITTDLAISHGDYVDVRR